MSMQDEKAALIEQIKHVREVIGGLINDVDPNLIIHADSGWRLRDILVHVTAWEQEAIAAAEAHIGGGPELPLQNIPKFNQDAYEGGRQADAQSVQDAWLMIYDDLIDVVTRAPEESWDIEFICTWGELGTLAQLVRSILSHDEEHAAEIRRAINESVRPT